VAADACFDDGTFLVREYHRSAESQPPPMHVVRRRLDGTIVGTLGDFWPGAFNAYVIPQVGVAAAGREFYVGDPRASEVKVLDRDGKLVRIVRTDDPIAKVTRAEADALRPLAVGVGQGANPDPDRFPKPSVWPSYGRIAVDPDGRLWVEDTEHGRDLPDGWTAFTRSGIMIGRVILPPHPNRADPRFVSFTEGGVQLRREDADGAVHISTYTLTRR